MILVTVTTQYKVRYKPCMHGNLRDNNYVHLQTVNLYTYRELPEFGDEKSWKTVQDFS